MKDLNAEYNKQIADMTKDFDKLTPERFVPCTATFRLLHGYHSDL